MKITTSQFFECVDFAKNVIESNLQRYKERKQDNVLKIFNDIVIGKIGEFGMYNYILSQKKECNLPDLKIYGVSDKNFEADLMSGKNKIHVKSQDYYATKDFPLSWSFQSEDSLTYKPEDNDFIAFTLVKGLDVEVKKCLPASKLVGKYRNPIIERLVGHKKVIYLIDLIDREKNKGQV